MSDKTYHILVVIIGALLLCGGILAGVGFTPRAILACAIVMLFSMGYLMLSLSDPKHTRD